ncbi:hypothetical protein BT566P1_00042 [Bacteroides phage BT566P1]|nr:hypothetical protein BT566P1_00042 [Bacteroides phage BT566P1]WAX09438.1 hypothetical protein BT566P2_00009 [Bacteroides phage BT566P2]
MKYSINISGNIVAERDIYSLGGFIPKNSVGCKVANGDQISQDGECWVAGGDISARPDVRVKDNAYIGTFTPGANQVYTDGITEFSGNTLIPGNISVGSLVADPVNNFFARDSFIGVSMDVLCGPVATATAFPFEQGGFNKDVPAGTLFTSASMRTGDANICRTTANLCLGKDTYLYFPIGYNCRVFWGYRNTAGQLAYSGESFVVPQNLIKLEHPTYKMAMIHIAKADGTAMTPADLLATGAKILGHINGSLLQDFRPESASGQYVMDKSSFIIGSRNFGLNVNVAQIRLLAGGLYSTSMYTLDDRADYQVYGTFHNVQRLEYTKYLGNTHRTNVNRDRYISAYDCPLLRVDGNTYNDALAAKGDLVLRRCIVPKAIFTDNIHNGNTYEDIDFSYTRDHLGAKAGNNYDMWSSHKQGEYAAIGAGTAIAGLISRPENLAAGSILGPGIDSVPLNGSIMEQGAYAAGANIGAPYEEAKVASNAVVRSYKPVSTAGLPLPTVPSDYVLDAIVYLDESFIIRKAVANPASIETTYPYAVMQFRKADTSRLNVSNFIALGLSLRMIDYAKAPEITGSAYVGAGCTVRGDVQLIGDPYVNRVFDVNMWERGNSQPLSGGKWQDGFFGNTAFNRFRSKDLIPVEPGGTVSRASGGSLVAWFFDGDKRRTASSGTGWVTSFVVPANVYFVGIVLEKTGGETLLTEDDIAISGIKYVRAFKKRRYIVNELDRTSPEDILLGPDKWGQSYLNRTAGKKYSELMYANANGISLNTPINVPASATVNVVAGYVRAGVNLDALLVCLTDALTPPENVALQGFALRKDPVAAILPSDVPASRLVMEFTPSPRIVTPYGLSNITVGGAKVRMYDNAVLSKPMDAATQRGEIVLSGDAVARYDFVTDPCMCSNGHSDAIIKLP